MGNGFAVEVEGLRELQRELRRADRQLPREIRKVNLKAAEVVADEARRRAPVVTGRLRNSIKARAGQREASVKAGTAARVPYAGPLIYGHRPRKQGGYMTPNPFMPDALRAKADEVSETYQADLGEWLAEIL